MHDLYLAQNFISIMFGQSLQVGVTRLPKGPLAVMRDSLDRHTAHVVVGDGGGLYACMSACMCVCVCVCYWHPMGRS